MRLFLTAAVIVLSSFAMAQTNTSTMQTKDSYSARKTGLEVGLAYTNLTSFTSKTKVSSKSNAFDTQEVETNGSDAAQYNGISLGVKSLSDSSFGYGLNANYLTGKERDLDSDLYQVVGNLNYSFTSMFYGFAGANVSYLKLKESSYNGAKFTTEPGLGGQIGLGLNINGFQLEAAYTVISSTLKASAQDIDANVNINANGLAAKVGYVF